MALEPLAALDQTSRQTLSFLDGRPNHLEVALRASHVARQTGTDPHPLQILSGEIVRVALVAQAKSLRILQQFFNGK